MDNNTCKTDCIDTYFFLLELHKKKKVNSFCKSILILGNYCKFPRLLEQYYSKFACLSPFIYLFIFEVHKQQTF